jgi:hypothetical protein
MREIPLSGGRLHLPSGAYALVDDADYDRLFGMTWRLLLANNRRVFAATGRSTLMHRLLLEAPSDKRVVHANGDGLDNRRSNLRLVTPSQATAKYWSRAVRSPSEHSHLRGVSHVEGRLRPWRATISVEGKQQFLGYHLTEEGAGLAYDHAAKRAFGEFAQLNFPYRGGI